MDRRALGSRVREARELAGLSQHAAAEALGLPHTAVTQIEAGNRSLSTLELSQLAALLRRPVGWFLRNTEDVDEDLLVVLHRVSAELSQSVLSAGQEASGEALLHALGLSDELATPMEENRGSRELRNQVALLAFDAFRAAEISRGRLLDIGRLIGINGRTLLKLAEVAETEQPVPCAIRGPSSS